MIWLFACGAPMTTTLGTFTPLPGGDGQRIAVDGPRAAVGIPGGDVSVWDGDRLVWRGGASPPPWGRPVLANGVAWGLTRWNGSQVVPVSFPARTPFPGPIVPDGVEWDPTGTRLYVWYGSEVVEVTGGKERPVGRANGRIDAIWPVGDDVWAVGAEVARVGHAGRKGHEMQILASSLGGGKLLTVDSVNARVWDLSTGEPGPNRLQQNAGGAMSPDGRVAVTFSGTTLRVFCVPGNTLEHLTDLSLPPGVLAIGLGADRLVAAFADAPRVRTAWFDAACR